MREPAPKQGYFVGGGLRSGFLSVGSSEVEDLESSFLGAGATLRFGEYVRPWLGLGGVAHGFFAGNDGFQSAFGSFSMEGHVAPFQEVELTFRGSIGPFVQSVTRNDDELTREDDPTLGFGAAITGGVSYGWFPFYDRSENESGGLELNVYLDGQALLSEDFTSGGIFVGIEVHYFFGLSKDKLLLPLEDAF
ncbi:MAG: hypothetical protein ACFB9M_17630 [Myxococcota bacterium]